MARIVHIAVKVDDLEKATEFYEKSFGFVEVETGQVRDHTSRHLTDGTIDLALPAVLSLRSCRRRDIKRHRQNPRLLNSRILRHFDVAPCRHPSTHL